MGRQNWIKRKACNGLHKRQCNWIGQKNGGQKNDRLTCQTNRNPCIRIMANTSCQPMETTAEEWSQGMEKKYQLNTR